jgi:ribonuclease Z
MAADLVQHLLVPWDKEMAMRQAHREYPSTPHPEVHDFEPPPTPAALAEFDEMTVEVSQVRHEPVSDAVGYRITTPDGVVAISGDTAVCSETEALASGADVLVHEAFFAEKLDPETVSDRDALAAYHSDPEPVGELARRAGVKTLMLTHLIPPPHTELDAGAFEAAVRRGGFEGNVIVCSDLDSVTF